MGKKGGKGAAAPSRSASAEKSGESGAGTGSGAKKNHNKYRKDKPWDHEGIDHWKIEVGPDPRHPTKRYGATALRGMTRARPARAGGRSPSRTGK